MPSELDQKIQDVYKRIETERKVLDASRMLGRATNNPDVLRGTEAKIKEAERSLSYFEETLRELQARKKQQSQREDPLRSDSPGSSSPTTPRGGRLADRDRSLPPPPADSPARGGRFASTSDIPQAGLAGAEDTDGTPKGKQYTNLDLIKVDTPYTTAKISRMLHQLEFKLQVEMQYKKGIDKMAKLYQADGDKKSRSDAESKRVESEKKIQLLQSALKRYKNLHILDDVEEEEEPQDGPGQEGERKSNLRAKPISGKLHVTVKGARELDHAPIVAIGRSRSSSKQVSETYISLKIEGTQRARSHPSRTDRWNEDFEITVDKANEVEIAVYDKQISAPHPVPIGLLWVTISDLVEALRRQKVMMESGQGGWVTAGAMDGDSPTGRMPPQMGGAFGDANAPLSMGPNSGGQLGQMSFSTQSEGIDAWFAVEPAGAIALQLNFVKENVRKRPLDAPGGLGRQGAVRKRKGEVHEMNGHKFVQRQFYQLMLCAFCNDFLLNALGYQCEDCRYTCHKKCYEKVVTKCISKSNTGEGDEEKINHRIPHRFEPLTNMGANWCCHCGYMLPLGRKNARKCSECDITCHANCAHLVPDFCGMSMETANQLLRDWRDINKARGGKAAAPSRPLAQTHTSQAQPQGLPPSDIPITQSMDRLQLTGGEVSSPAIGADPFGRGTPTQDGAVDPRYFQQPAPTSNVPPRPPPGARIPVPPAYPNEPILPAAPQGSIGYDQVVPQDGYSIPPYPPKIDEKSQPVYPQALPPKAPPGQTPYRPEKMTPVQAIPAQQRQATRKRKVGLDDFNFLAVLGKGNFGKVMLAEEKKSNSLYAIKVLKKEFIIDNDEVESTRSEKRVFLAAARERHPFLLGLHSCFQTETRVYFVMEYVSGGDLMLHIQRKQFSLRQAKFYASEVLLALEYFHANDIVYRDLKLDNILLTLDGHVKVADYGLCKEGMGFGDTTSTFCGTPEFMAPEILLEQRYGRAVDWWAFGVLTYEMLLGQSPFRGDDEDEIFDAILEDEPLYPITMPRDAVSILQKLLTRDPTRRLGSTKADAEEIKRHPFFKDVNFDDVLNKRIPPPYFPTINGTADTSNFDEEFTKEQPTLTPVHGQLSARDQQEFGGFSWVAAWADI
ncbi:hypothetical protein BJ138DRAFT_1152001 [Hygrophoropsis aurantiaca]|uniref:Uncharacterized protein n=1 Tax=Hygrophoropsis aurantiaca TaxID=72124 RepID=A0ACB8ACM1_9AGAM|nr:hypothetical protein BJ138DRAFT_1152001 [Hygrophoropsis aurantiaca]